MPATETIESIRAGESLCQIGAQHFRFSEICADDQAEVLQLFAAAFDHNPAAGWYQWKYGSNDSGAVGLWDEDGHLAAHYAGFPRELRWQGVPVQAIQIGDVMVAPKVRGLLTRKGPLFQVCSRFFASRVGNEQAYKLAFGFPNKRHMQLGVTLDLYHDAGTIHQISWQARQRDLAFGWHWSPLVAGEDLTRLVGHAWQSMSKDFSGYVLGVRDANFVRQRFLNRPDRDYRIFCLRRWPFGESKAIAVMQVSEGRAELLDVIGARNLFATVVRAAAAEAARAGAATLTAWASLAALAVFQKTGAESVGTAAHLAVAKASALTASDVAAAPWWWMGGDTDFL